MTAKKNPPAANGGRESRTRSKEKWATRHQWAPNAWDVALAILGSGPLYGKLLKAHGKQGLKQAAIKTLEAEPAPGSEKAFFIAACKGMNGAETPKSLAVKASQGDGASSQRLLQLALEHGVPTRGVTTWALAEAIQKKLSDG